MSYAVTEGVTELVGVSIEAELKHESSLLASGAAQYQDRVIKRVQKRQETLMDYGKNLVARTIEPLAGSIRTFLAESALGPGRKHTAAKYLSASDPDVLAFITAQSVFDRISLRSPYQAAAMAIGRAVEDEIRFSVLKADKPGLYARVMERLAENPDGYQQVVRRKTLAHVIRKFDVVVQKWKPTEHLHVGSKLIELLIQATGLIRLARDTAHHDTKIYLEATPELSEMLRKFKGRAEFLHPHWQPMLRPPKPWSSPYDGGYLHEQLAYKLIKTARRGHLAELEVALMPDVYQAVNALQDTAWKVDTRMLDIVTQVWDAGMKLKGLPPKFDIPLPPKPEAPRKGEGNTPRMQAWWAYKDEGAEVFRANRKHQSKRMQIVKILSLANKFQDAPALWFPVRLDFRGRMYSVPQYLNPQGTDLAKSLLTFSQGKAIDERGEFWLAVHLANSFGYDKVGLEARESWTRLNSWKIEQVGDDPLNHTWWMEADKPFQFLAACLEWNAYLQAKGEGEPYVSHLPVMVDGSCNGLQHFAAMLRDPVAGRYVNLVPSDKPNDIYQRVADAVTADLLSDTFKTERVAQQWLAYGIDRKLAKRPTMVLPYGGTRDAVRSYIGDFVAEQDAEERKSPGSGKANPFGDAKATKAAVTFLATVMWKAMARVVVGPMQAMQWLRTAAQTASAEGLPLGWTTPTGFIVQQAYPNMTKRRIKTKIGDEIVKFTMLEETAKLDKRRQATALAPNFVHSLDAAALMLTINLVRRLGVNNFTAVHDAYGTHAADMDALQAGLREVFVEMYEGSDVLAQFAKQLLAVTEMEGKELPPMPVKGTLDLAGIRQSDFFFA